MYKLYFRFRVLLKTFHECEYTLEIPFEFEQWVKQNLSPETRIEKIDVYLYKYHNSPSVGAELLFNHPSNLLPLQFEWFQDIFSVEENENYILTTK